MIRLEQYKKLKYNVAALPPTKKVLEVWPDLARIPDFKNKFKAKLDHDKVLRYILVLYDKNTPLLTDIPGIEKRKNQAAEVALFEKDKNNRFSEDVYKMFRCQFPDINKAILTFSKMHRSSIWETYITIQSVHYRNQQDLLNGDAEKFTTKDLKEEADRLDELRDILTNDDKDEALKASLHDYVMEELLLRPEDIAEKIKNGERVTDIEPYK